jgi:GTPase
LVGLPNAGKSTLLNFLSQAAPKIGDYPFTTLHPQLGTVASDAYGHHCLVFADLPGLIHGAHLGKGLGHRFLGHVERCKALFHVLDSSCENVFQDYQDIRNELGQYNPKLLEKTEIICFNKIDLLSTQALDDLKKAADKYFPHHSKVFYSFLYPNLKDLFLEQIQFLLGSELRWSL